MASAAVRRESVANAVWFCITRRSISTSILQCPQATSRSRVVCLVQSIQAITSVYGDITTGPVHIQGYICTRVFGTCHIDLCRRHTSRQSPCRQPEHHNHQCCAHCYCDGGASARLSSAIYSVRAQSCGASDNNSIIVYLS